MKKTSDIPELFEKKCAHCGKIFYPAYDHVFKKNGSWFCKYSCELAFERKQEEKILERKNKRCHSVILTDVESGMVYIFKTAVGAANVLGLCVNEIRKCCRGERPFYQHYKCEYGKEKIL